MFHGYLEIFAGNAATKKLKLNSFGRHVAHLSIRIVSDYLFALLGLTFYIRMYGNSSLSTYRSSKNLLLENISSTRLRRKK